MKWEFASDKEKKNYFHRLTDEQKIEAFGEMHGGYGRSRFP